MTKSETIWTELEAMQDATEREIANGAPNSVIDAMLEQIARLSRESMTALLAERA